MLVPPMLVRWRIAENTHDKERRNQRKDEMSASAITLVSLRLKVARARSIWANSARQSSSSVKREFYAPAEFVV